MGALKRALDDLGFDLEGQTPTVAQTPKAAARFDALLALIKRTLLRGDEFREDERLIVFTEYKTTLDYLARRLRERFAEERVLTLYGGGSAEGMGDAERDHVKAAFNDPSAPVHHFVSEADADLQFLAHVIHKADEIREDLGSVNEVFDRAAHRRRRPHDHRRRQP